MSAPEAGCAAVKDVAAKQQELSKLVVKVALSQETQGTLADRSTGKTHVFLFLVK
jgi:hypothetical protein